MRCYAIFVLVLALPAIGISATIYVPDDYSTIQGAINAASPGDTVIVRAGTYYENIDFDSKDLIVESELGPAHTTIDGGQLANVVAIRSGQTSAAVLEGFTITNGDAYWDGSGVLITNASSPVVRNNIITDNHGAREGGGVYCGGLGCDATIINNIITNNSALNNGGGIRVTNCAPLIEANIITANSATNGGGIQCYDDASPTITRNTIRGNSASFSGGGIKLYTYGNPIISRNRICANTAVSAGGGIDSAFVEAVITGNVIANNTTDYNGGGIYYRQGSAEISNNMVCGNSSITDGGGIMIYDNSDPLLINNTIADNTTTGNGGGLVCNSYCDVDLVNNIFWNNADPAGIEIWIFGTSNVTISHSDVDGGQNACAVGSNCTLNWGAGMIDDDPLFVESAENDYHLPNTSPCIDMGDTHAALPTEDFEGDLRAVNGIPEIGADEHSTHLYVTVYTPAGGGVTPGGTGSIKVVGTPGEPVTVVMSDRFRKDPRPTAYGDFYLLPHFFTISTGTIPADGVAIFYHTAPTYWRALQVHPFQALVGPMGGANSVLTNLMLLFVE